MTKSRLTTLLVGAIGLGVIVVGATSCKEIPENVRSYQSFESLGTNEQGYPEYRHHQTGIVMVRLPGGTFRMGSPDTETNRFFNESPVHKVALDPFLIAKHEVTQAQYEAVMGSNPSLHEGNDQRPVERVSWLDLKAPDGFLARTGLSLPSEAQWEYACRGGTTTVFSSPNPLAKNCNQLHCDPCGDVDDFMWWCGITGDTAHPVGKKQANPFGLHDMHGNVSEWCEDVFDNAFYGKPEAKGPNPVATSGSEFRVFRGGGWNDAASLCRSAIRNFYVPGHRDGDTGFRPVFGPLP